MNKLICGSIYAISLFLIGSSIHSVAAASVPDQYYPNYRIDSERETLLGLIEDLEAATSVGTGVSRDKFRELNTVFDEIFEYFPSSPSNNVIYKQCLLTTQQLSSEVTMNDYAIFKDRCFTPLGDIVQQIQSRYTVKAKIDAKPKEGPAPLNVTLDARGSIDPSNDTIPSDNFFWYYKDVYGDDQQIGRGPVVNHSFEEPGNHIVHLTVRSSNNDTEGIFDGEASVSINVAPKSANVVLYVNGKQASSERILKVGSQDAKKGILLDATATTPIGARTIQEYTWQITSNEQYAFKQSGQGEPTQFIHKFPANGVYTIALEIVDNEGNRLRETFLVSVSDPVAAFKFTPEKGNTSTLFAFDASPSYSITSRLSKYERLITDPQGKQLDVIQSKELKRKFTIPGTYTIKLTVTDEAGSNSYEAQQIYVSSTPPVPTFTMQPESEVALPSQFIFDATATFDEDVRSGGDALTYRRLFSNSDYVKIERSLMEDQSKIRVVFDQPGIYSIKLIVEDSFGEMVEVEKEVDVKSTLRPEIFITPQVGARGNEITFLGKVNKPVAFYEWDFGDGKKQQSQTPKVTRIYERAGTYKVVLKVRTEDGEENQIVKYVFQGQKDTPIPAYQVKTIGDIALAKSTICKDDQGADVEAYRIQRYENFILDATLSTNAQGTMSDLAISFRPQNDEVYNKALLNYNFLELGCWYIDLFVEDSNLGKTESTRVRFETVNALPMLQNLMLDFPQVQGGSASIGVGVNTNSITSSNVFSDPTIASIVVRVSAQGARDPDGFISHYRRYYYPTSDPARKEGFKVTPSDVPYATFVIAKPAYATEYSFSVDMIDNDEGKISSEELIGKGPVIFFPPGENSLDVPIVTLTANMINTKVGEEVTFTTKATVLSERPDFETTRYFKYDFDGDGLYDMPPTKKEVVTWRYTEPGEKRPKVTVFYRGRAGVGNSEPIVVRKGLNPVFEYDTYGTIVLIKNFSIGEIVSSTLCMDVTVCDNPASGNVIELTDEALVYTYPAPGKYLTKLNLLDEFGNEQSRRVAIDVTATPTEVLGIVSVPQGSDNADGAHEITVGANLENTVTLYLASSSNCYADIDVTADSNGDGDPTIDEDVPCNTVVTKQFFPTSRETIGRIYYVDDGKIIEKDIRFIFLDVEQQAVNQEYQRAYDEITGLLESISSTETDTIMLFYRDLLLNLQSSLGEKDQMSSLIIQLRDLLSSYPSLLTTEDRQTLDTLLLALSDSTVTQVFGGTVYETAKANVVVRFQGEQRSRVEELFTRFESVNGDPTSMKPILDEVFTVAAEVRSQGSLDEVDFNYIKKNLCDIVVYYELPSRTCGTEVETDVVDGEGDGEDTPSPARRTLIGNVLRIFLIVVIVLAVVFVALIVVFAVKARKQKKSDQEPTGNSS